MHVYYAIGRHKVRFNLSNTGTLTAAASLSGKITAGEQYTAKDINAMTNPVKTLNLKDRLNLGFGWTEFSKSFGVVKTSPTGNFFVLEEAKNYKHLQRILADTSIYPLTPTEMMQYYKHHDAQRWRINLMSVVRANTYDEYINAIRTSRDHVGSNIVNNDRARISFVKSTGKFDYSGYEYDTYDQAVESHNRSLDLMDSKKSIIIKEQSIDITNVISDRGTLYFRDLSKSGLGRYRTVRWPVYVPEDREFYHYERFKNRVDAHREQDKQRREKFFDTIVNSPRPSDEEVCIAVRGKKYVNTLYDHYAHRYSLSMDD